MLPPKKVCSPLYPIYFSPHISFKPHTMMINFTQDPAEAKEKSLRYTVFLSNALSGLKDFSPLSLRGLGTKPHKLGSPPHYVERLPLAPYGAPPFTLQPISCSLLSYFLTDNYKKKCSSM